MFYYATVVFCYLKCVAILIVVPILALYYLNSIKNRLKFVILTSTSSNFRTQIIKNFETTNSNIKEYYNEMEKAGNVVKVKSSASNYVITAPFVFEYFSSPGNLFNLNKARDDLIFDANRKDLALQSSYNCIILTKLLAANISQKNITKSEYLVNKHFLACFKHHSFHVKDGTFLVEDLFSYIQDVLQIKVLVTNFGENAVKDTKFFETIGYFLSSPSNYSDYNRGLMAKFRKMISYRKEQINHNVIVNFIKKLIKDRLATPKKYKNYDDLIQLAIKSSLIVRPNADSVIFAIYLMVILEIQSLGSKLANFIVDLSLFPETYSKLALEQKRFVRLYGDYITIAQLDKMDFLDASLLESIRLSPSTGSARKVAQSYILSSGTCLEKDSVVRFSEFLYNRNPKIFGENPHDFYPERHIQSGTKLFDSSLKNLTWGLGGVACPARIYCSIQLKLFAAIFIRRYEVFHKNRFIASEHKGYNFKGYIFHATTNIFLKPHNIRYYNSVFSDH